jgi:hypothetical protein
LLVCVVLYSILALVRYGHYSSVGTGHITGPATMDSIIQIWWLSWTSFAFPHLHLLFSAPWENYPKGTNFGVSGSMIAVGVLLLPLTKIFGVTTAWNIGLRLAVVVSATSMCLVLRRWTSWWPAAFIGGLLYGFSAYMQWYSYYLFLLFVPLPPLILLFLHELFVRQRWQPWITGLLLGGSLVVQFFVFTEILASTLVMGAFAIGGMAIVHRRDLIHRWRYAVKAAAWCLVAMAIVLAYPVWFTFAGPEHINGTPAAASFLALFQSDLAASVVPSAQWLSTPSLHRWVSTRPRILDSGELYLGIPLLAALSALAIVFRRRRAILYAGAMALIAFVLSLGATLNIDNRDTGLRLPFWFFLHIPVLKGFLATRFSLFTDLFVAMMFAIGLDAIRRRTKVMERKGRVSPRRSLALAYGAAGVLVLIVGLSLAPASQPVSTPSDTPTFFTSSEINAIPRGSVVLAYPYTDSEMNVASTYAGLARGRDIMLYQAITNMRFKIVGGYGWFPTPGGQNGINSPPPLAPASVQTLFDVELEVGAGKPTASQQAVLSENLTSDLRHYLTRHDIQTVIVLPGFHAPAALIRDMTDAIGVPTQQGGVVVWLHVQDRVATVGS